MQPTNGVAAASSSSTDADGGTRSSADLPLHVTEKILHCISPLESARLATVCQPWATTVSARLAGPLAPHLFLHMPREHNSDRSGFIVPVPLDGGARGRPPLAAITARVRRADTGSLVSIGATPSGRVAFLPFLSRPNVFVVNPVTGVSRWIDLGMKTGPKQVLPVATGVEALLSINDRHGVVLSWRRAAGADDYGVWDSAVVKGPWPMPEDILSVASHNNFFYVLHDKGCVSVIDAAAPAQPLRMEPVVLLPRGSGGDQQQQQQFSKPLTHRSEARLVESGGEILLVRRLVEFKELAVPTCEHNRMDLVVVGFEVYRLDAGHQRWTPVEELARDQALFVSPQSSFAVRASETAGCRSNCIYYVRNKRYCSLCHTDSANTCWGVYSLGKQEVLFEHDLIETGRCTAAMWFVPSVV